MTEKGFATDSREDENVCAHPKLANLAKLVNLANLANLRDLEAFFQTFNVFCITLQAVLGLKGQKNDVKLRDPVQRLTRGRFSQNPFLGQHMATGNHKQPF